FTFTDAGEPGTSDTAKYLIWMDDGDGIVDNGEVPVLSVSTKFLTQGNHQAHKETCSTSSAAAATTTTSTSTSSTSNGLKVTAAGAVNGSAVTNAVLVAPGTSLPVGLVFVAVDGLTDSNAPVEQARIEDAIDATNSDLGRLGIMLVETTPDSGIPP